MMLFTEFFLLLINSILTLILIASTFEPILFITKYQFIHFDIWYFSTSRNSGNEFLNYYSCSLLDIQLGILDTFPLWNTYAKYTHDLCESHKIYFVFFSINIFFGGGYCDERKRSFEYTLFKFLR